MPCGRWQLYEGSAKELYLSQRPVRAEAYRTRVERACTFLEGQCQKDIQSLEKKMKTASSAQRYEEASHCRDMMHDIHITLRPKRVLSLPEISAPQGACEQLAKALGIARIDTIEGFDVAHISGQFVVGSAVRFVSGKRDRRFRRTYHVRDKIQNDDYRAMHHIVRRHFLNLHQRQGVFPDLVLVDGGIGQLQATLSAFQDPLLAPYLDRLCLMALAKKEERIYRLHKKPLVLERHHAGLRLLQCVRDEAHRVANTFHRNTRNAYLKKSVFGFTSGHWHLSHPATF